MREKMAELVSPLIIAFRTKVESLSIYDLGLEVVDDGVRKIFFAANDRVLVLN